MLTVDTIPLQQVSVVGRQVSVVSGTRHLNAGTLLSFLMRCVLAATATELAELKPIRRGLFILGRYVVAALAINTLKNNIIAWHFFLFPISDCNCRLEDT